MPIPSLPTEILGIIFYANRGRNDRTAVSCALVCRRFLPLARSFLYYHLIVDSAPFDYHALDQDTKTGEEPDDEEEPQLESKESDADRYFYHHFDLPSRQLLRTMASNPSLGVYVECLTLNVLHLEVDHGERLLELAVAPCPNLQDLEISALGWGARDSQTFDDLLSRLSPNLTDLVIPGAHWSRSRLARLLPGFPKLDYLRLHETKEPYSDWGASPVSDKDTVPPSHQLSILAWDGFCYLDQETFWLVAESSAASLSYLRIPINDTTLDFSSFSNLVEIDIETRGTGFFDDDLDNVRGVVVSLQGCRTLKSPGVADVPIGDDVTHCEQESWEMAQLLESLPSSLTILDIHDILISLSYLLIFLRNTSLAPKLSKLKYAPETRWYRDPAHDTTRRDIEEIKKLCAERGIKLLKQRDGRWERWLHTGRNCSSRV